MIYKYGNIFEDITDKNVIIVPSGNYIRNNGGLDMGFGSTRQMRMQFSGCDFIFGNMIKEHKFHNKNEDYQYIQYIHYLDKGYITLGLLQIKRLPTDNINLSILEESLKSFKTLTELDIENAYNMVYPGCPYIHKEKVDSLLNTLPDNVFIWRYKNSE